MQTVGNHKSTRIQPLLGSIYNFPNKPKYKYAPQKYRHDVPLPWGNLSYLFPTPAEKGRERSFTCDGKKNS